HCVVIEAAFKELADLTNSNVNLTALQFEILETMLRCAVKNGLPKCTESKTILSKHKEEQLVGYCKNIQRLEFGLTKSGVNHYVIKIVRNNYCAHLFATKGPGRAWWDCFMKDYSDLSFQTLQALSEAYAQRANPIIIKDHFKKLQKIIKKHSLTAESIWNIDETKFVIALKHIFVAPTISVAGVCILPLIIYKDVHTILELLAKGLPVLLILDGHKNHINYTSIKFCHENEILLYALSLHITYILQASEFSFAKLKMEYNNSYEKLHHTKREVATNNLLLLSHQIIQPTREPCFNPNSKSSSTFAFSFSNPNFKPSSTFMFFSSSQPSYKYFTRTSIFKDIEILKVDVMSLEKELSLQTNEQEFCEAAGV
ncbi:2941_t:CDS:2, partial [Cetraspora pellucida]